MKRVASLIPNLELKHARSRKDGCNKISKYVEHPPRGYEKTNFTS